MRWKPIALGLSIAASSLAAAQEPGDWVLSRWRGSTQYFPGVVQSRHGDVVNVRFDDGTVSQVPVSQIRPYDWRVGTAVECRWTDGRWYAAVITAMGDDAVSLDVLYEDGDRQHTATGNCRSTQ